MAEYCGVKWNRPQCVNMLNVIPDIYPKNFDIVKSLFDIWSPLTCYNMPAC